MMNVVNTLSFYDLCISEKCLTIDDLETTITQIYNLGYRTIAVNQTVEDGALDQGKKKKKKGEPRESNVDVVPVPFDKEKINEAVVKHSLRNFKIFNRLTVRFSSQDLLHKITKSQNYKKYDIVAALPTTSQALMFTCSTFEADILTFDFENKNNIKMNRKAYGQLVDRGFHLELQYGPAVQDSSKRKKIINMAHLFYTFGKSRNIVLSSGTDSLLYLRSPYDVINLGFLLGLSELKCKAALTNNPKKVILNSAGRRCGKSIMLIENIEKRDENLALEIDESLDEDINNQPAQKKFRL